MSATLFEAALGIVDPWHVQGVDFDAGIEGAHRRTAPSPSVTGI